MEFNEEQYKKFIFSKVEKKTNCPLEELVKGLSQFDQSISKYLNIGNQQKISYHMINIFGSFLKEKPKKVMHQDWFLHKFGYKYCAGLKKPIISEKFSVSKVNWDKLDNYSREHKALTRDANYQTEYNKIYVQNNLDKHSAKEARRRALKQDAITNNYSRKDEELVYWLREFISNDLKLELHVDHIISISNGGNHDRYNWQILTAKDNLRKNNIDKTKVAPIISNDKLIWFLNQLN